MLLKNAILCAVFVIFAAGYGWGMRGTVIGGEKGAMLPGMYIGLLLALFSPSGIREYFWIPAAAGLIGMTFGGIEPYGDTIQMIIDDIPALHKPVRGYIGLALKGGLWFSVCGGMIGLSFSAMGGKYKAFELVLFCLLIPVFQSLGYKIFNQPYDKENNIFPKIYFCSESREEWGSNVGILALLCVFSLIKGDNIALTLASSGLLFGAIGWVFAITFYYFTVHPFSNGKYLFGKLYEKHLIDGWKNMEFSLGSIGGLGIFLGFYSVFDEIESVSLNIMQNGLFAPLDGKDGLVIAIMIIFALLLIAVNVYEYVCDGKGIKYNSFHMDLLERPLFNVLPLIFVLLCSLPAARLMTAFMLIFALSLKCCFDRFEKGANSALPFIIFGGCSLAAFILDIVLGGFSPEWLFFVGGLPYVLSEIIWRITHHKKEELNRLLFHSSFTVVMGFETFQVLVITIVAFILL